MSRVFVLLLICVAAVGALCGTAFAETKPPVEPTREQLQLDISLLQDHIKKLESELKSRPANVDPILQKAYIEAERKYYEYLAAIMDIRIRAFQTQRLASNVILLLVVLVVVAGIMFAGFQLWKSVSVAGVQQSNELELSASKVRVTSSVVGVVVLTISLVFLYIYTKEVYHISEVALQSQTKK
jgi:hypothetical protein